MSPPYPTPARHRRGDRRERGHMPSVYAGLRHQVSGRVAGWAARWHRGHAVPGLEVRGSVGSSVAPRFLPHAELADPAADLVEFLVAEGAIWPEFGVGPGLLGVQEGSIGTETRRGGRI